MRKYTIIAAMLACLGAAELLYGQGRAVTASGIMYIRTLLSADGSASAPSVAFASATDKGFSAATNLLVVSTGGNGRWAFDSSGSNHQFTLAGTQLSFSNSAGVFGNSIDTSLSRVSAGLFGVNGVPTVAFVTADFSTTSVSLATITGLSWTLPASTARNVPFSCKLYYSQSTAAVADALGFQVATVAPTNAQVGGAVETALGTTAYGDATFTTTTAANVVAFTPSAISTIFNAYVDGFIEAPSNGSIATVNIMALTGNASDALVVKRGSFCRIY